MHIFWKASAALLLCASAAWALQESKEKTKSDDKPKAEQPAGAKEAVEAVQQELQTLGQELGKKYREAKTDEERQAIRDQFFKARAGFAAKFLAVAEKFPKDSAAFDALAQVVMMGGSSKEGEKAIEIISANHVENERIGQMCMMLGNSDSPAAEKLLRAVLEKNSKKEAQGQAAYGLAQHFKTRYEQAATAKKPEADKLGKEAEKFYELVVSKYADVNTSGSPLGETAKGELFELKNLAVGKVAPDTEGEDSDGKKFKLGDYRGKVVVIDFWAGW